MGSRDHSETCEECGVRRGGLNDLQCLCMSPIRDTFSRYLDLRKSDIDQGKRIAELLAERDHLVTRVAELEQTAEDMVVDYGQLKILFDTVVDDYIDAHDTLTRERDQLAELLDAAVEDYTDAHAECERMRTVMDAAVAWHRANTGQHTNGPQHTLAQRDTRAALIAAIAAKETP